MVRGDHLLVCVYMIISIGVFYFIFEFGGILTSMNKETDFVPTSCNECRENKEEVMDFFRRVSNLQYQCTIHGGKCTEPMPILFVAKRTNLKFCKVSKSGGTFWMKVFITLNKIADTEGIFGRRRLDIHIIGNRYGKKAKLSDLSREDKIILVARDPFSRLFSAFVDRIYLPGSWARYHSISKDNTDMCDKRNTFEVFINFIIRKSAEGKLSDEHWAPITEYCGLCRVPYNFILKHETFQRDVAYVLNNMEMEDSDRQVLLRGLGEKNTEYSMEEVLREQIYVGRNSRCLTFMDFCNRLWNAFQIQGYISNHVAFPRRKFVGHNFSSTDTLLDIYLEGVKSYRLSANEKRLQRNQHLRDAYKSIGSESLQKIIQIYKHDFTLLNYSSTPPHLRSN